MSRKRYSPEQIIGYLREAEVLQAKRSTIPKICSVTEQAYYGWRKEYVSLIVDQDKRLKDVDKEVTGPRKMVAEGKYSSLKRLKGVIIPLVI
jgi:putative transposase